MDALLALALLWPAAASAQRPATRSEPFSVPPVQGRPLTGEDDDGDFGIDGAEPLPNFSAVSSGVYRSGQPNREGLVRLASLGVRTVISLREKVDPAEAAEAARLGMSVAHVPMSGYWTPRFEQIDRALALIADPARRPVVVHCKHGKDRTGYTIAAHRVAKERMPVDEAVAEAERHRCCLWSYRDLKDFLKDYLKR